MEARFAGLLSLCVWPAKSFLIFIRRVKKKRENMEEIAYQLGKKKKRERELPTGHI